MKFNLRGIEGVERLVEELAIGLKRLTLGDNFESFESSVTIAAGATAKIRNQLTGVPTQWVQLRLKGDGYLSEPADTWTRDHLYIKNFGTASVTATILFIK